jgi:hypothetical protein
MVLLGLKLRRKTGGYRNSRMRLTKVWRCSILRSYIRGLDPYFHRIIYAHLQRYYLISYELN